MRARGTIVRRVSSFVIVVAVGMAFGPAPAAARAGGDDALVVTPAYRLRVFRWHDQQVRALVFRNGEEASMRVATAYPSFSGRRVVSDIGTRSGAVAAVNGGFRVTGTDAPRHLTVIDGEIWTTGEPTQRGWAYSSTASGHRAWIGRTIPEIVATQGDVSFPVVGWNAQQPKADRVVAFTSRGGTARSLSTRTCTAILSPVSGAQEPHRVYMVEQVSSRPHTCDLAPLGPPPGYANVVLAGEAVQSLVEGAEIEIDIDLGHYGNVRHAFAGLPLLVDDGENVAPRCGDACDPKHGPDRCFGCRNPRTVIGIGEGCSDKDLATTCRGIMVTVDGRQDGWSEGLRLRALADMMIELGAYHAVNLDGGGSTQMWVRARNETCQDLKDVGCLVTRPAYEWERPRNEAITLVPSSG